ncbi:hypothetical protein ACVW0I_007615 [Bradyrhizobium sp. LM6.11]
MAPNSESGPEYGMTLPMRISLSVADCSARCSDIAPSDARAAIETNSSLPETRMLDTLTLALIEVGSICTRAA